MGNKISGEEAAEFSVLGVHVGAVQIPDVIQTIEGWIRSDGNRCRYIAVTGMHGVTEAQHDPQFRTILNTASLVVPDGMPLVWCARLRGYPLRRRVYGPELMLTLMEATAGKGYRHFFYGGASGVPEQLVENLRQRFPSLQLVGTYAPPFRPITAAEDEKTVLRINAAAPDIVWVGLGTPKQERWMYEHRHKLRAPVLIGVGAAFDINSGRVSQAPRWMREHGFEWLFRLINEPRRLWRRYLLYGPQFICWVALEFLGFRSVE